VTLNWPSKTILPPACPWPKPDFAGIRQVNAPCGCFCLAGELMQHVKKSGDVVEMQSGRGRVGYVEPRPVAGLEASYQHSRII
jgi:hypothetical protein